MFGNLTKRHVSQLLAGTALAAVPLMFAAIGWAQDGRTGDVVDPNAFVSALNSVPPGQALLTAMVRNNTAALCQVTASFNSTSPAQAAVFSPGGDIGGFPTHGSSFALLSSGIAANAPGTYGIFESTSFLGNRDFATLVLTFQLGDTPGNLTFDYKYGTEENPTFVGTPFQDPLNATVNPGAISMASLAVDTAAALSNGPLGGTSDVPTGPPPVPDTSVYNAVTVLQSPSQDVSALANGAMTLTIDIRDASDDILDTAVFLDNLRVDGCDTAGIDIKPGSFPNSINLDSGGAVPVAILGSDVLDVTNIDPGSVTLADAQVKMVGKSNKLLCSVEDVSGDFTYGPEGMPDGYDDLVCHMVTMDLSADCATTSANVTAIYNGILISGSDSVNIVKDGASCQP